MTIETKLAFKSDYAQEFGGDKPRIWRAFTVFKDNIDIGSLYEEPGDYRRRYHVHKGGFEISGDRVGDWYTTRKDALAALCRVS